MLVEKRQPSAYLKNRHRYMIGYCKFSFLYCWAAGGKIRQHIKKSQIAKERINFVVACFCNLLLQRAIIVHRLAIVPTQLNVENIIATKSATSCDSTGIVSIFGKAILRAIAIIFINFLCLNLVITLMYLLINCHVQAEFFMNSIVILYNKILTRRNALQSYFQI